MTALRTFSLFFVTLWAVMTVYNLLSNRNPDLREVNWNVRVAGAILTGVIYASWLFIRTRWPGGEIFLLFLAVAAFAFIPIGLSLYSSLLGGTGDSDEE